MTERTKIQTVTESVLHLNAQLVIQTVLEGSWGLTTVDTGDSFKRLHDDHDGSMEGKICVLRSDVDGDIYVYTETTGKMGEQWLRFRTKGGGGRSIRTHNALRILAEAIRLDAIEDPHE
jgi:hypothetical protein